MPNNDDPQIIAAPADCALARRLSYIASDFATYINECDAAPLQLKYVFNCDGVFVTIVIS